MGSSIEIRTSVSFDLSLCLNAIYNGSVLPLKYEGLHQLSSYHFNVCEVKRKTFKSKTEVTYSLCINKLIDSIYVSSHYYAPFHVIKIQ